MSLSVRKKFGGRERRKLRVRKKVSGTTARPRLSVFRSAKHIYAQLIDDERGVTVGAASTVSKNWKSLDGNKTAKAKEIGKAVAELAKSRDISKVVFDRNGYRYHGRVRAVAEGAREGGLEF